MSLIFKRQIDVMLVSLSATSYHGDVNRWRLLPGLWRDSFKDMQTQSLTMIINRIDSSSLIVVRLGKWM